MRFPHSSPSAGPLPSAGVNANYRPLAGGDAGIAQTIREMQKLVEGPEGARNATVRQQAITITRGVENGDKLGEIEAVHAWVQRNIKFQGEYGETLQTPVVTLRWRSGDCDDHSVLTAALLEALGFSTRFRTVAADRNAPRDFSHVYTEVMDPVAAKQGDEGWIALETTVQDVPLGWQPSGVTRSQSWDTLGALPRRPVARLNGLGDAPLENTLLNIANTFAADLAPAVATRVAGPNANLLQFSGPGFNVSGGSSYGTLFALGLFAVGLVLVLRRS